MIKHRDCAVYVNADGVYCARNKVYRVTDTPLVITLGGAEPIDLLVLPTGDTSDTPVPSGTTLTQGQNIVSVTGTYVLDIDFEALDGEAPTETPPITVCAQEWEGESAALIAQLLVGGSGADMAPVVSKLDELIALLECE